MARTLKIYVTTLGFFEHVVAAPSMKAALKAWGVTQNLFHQGFAKETDDPDIMAAALAAPGTVLKRAVGSAGIFKEHAELPDTLPTKTAPSARRISTSSKKAKQPTKTKISKAITQKRALAFENARAKREQERAREQAKHVAAEAKETERRRRTAEEAQSRFDAALERHHKKMGELEAQQQVIERKIDAETKRWTNEKAKLKR